MAFQCIQNKIQIAYTALLDLASCLTLSSYLTHHSPSLQPQSQSFSDRLKSFCLRDIAPAAAPAWNVPSRSPCCRLCTWLAGSHSLGLSSTVTSWTRSSHLLTNPLWHQPVLQPVEIFSLYPFFLLGYCFTVIKYWLFLEHWFLSPKVQAETCSFVPLHPQVKERCFVCWRCLIKQRGVCLQNRRFSVKVHVQSLRKVRNGAWLQSQG